MGVHWSEELQRDAQVRRQEDRQGIRASTSLLAYAHILTSASRSNSKLVSTPQHISRMFHSTKLPPIRFLRSKNRLRLLLKHHLLSTPTVSRRLARLVRPRLVIRFPTRSALLPMLRRLWPTRRRRRCWLKRASSFLERSCSRLVRARFITFSESH